MKSLIIIILILFLIASQINTIVSVDLWWNLKTGEYIIKNFVIPHHDIFSYTLTDQQWVDHEWLSQVILYSVFTKFGWGGLDILKALIISSCFLILLFLIYLKYRKIIYGLLFVLLSVLALGYRSFVRPEIFSYLFFCLYLFILERGKNLNLLPVLQVLWTNLHGYFVLGPALILLYWLSKSVLQEKYTDKKFASIFCFVILACFINPYFVKGALYPLRIFRDIFTEQRLFMRNVHELMMPIKTEFSKFLFLWILVISASITFLVNLRNVKLGRMIFFALIFLASYFSVRNIPFFIFTAMSLGAMNLNEANLTWKISEKRYQWLFLLIIPLLIYFFLSDRYYMFTNQDSLRKTGVGFSRLLMPSGACDFLETNRINGRIFNTLDFGPYIGYRFFPEKRIFIDTRTELYKDQFYMLYRDAQNYPDAWRSLHRRYGFDIALLRHLFGGTEKILRDLYRNEKWRLVYYDENSCIFLYRSPENVAHIKKLEIDLKNKHLTNSDININVARFFQKIGERELAEKIYIKLLKRNPDFLEAGNNLATIYIDTGRYKEGIDLVQRLLKSFPHEAALYANLGTAYLRLGKKEKGLFMLEMSARLNPYLRKASYLLGVVYLERGEVDRAERQFAKYLMLDPYNAGVHRILGDLYKQKGLLKKAKKEYNEAERLEGRSIGVVK